jgi:hypothetical protein
MEVVVEEVLMVIQVLMAMLEHWANLAVVLTVVVMAVEAVPVEQQFLDGTLIIQMVQQQMVDHILVV